MCNKVIYLACCVFVLGLSTAASADPNLVGYWKFDGDFLDSSGNGRHGTLSGDGEFVPGVFNEAIDLGGSEYVVIEGYKGILGAHAFSITAWIRTTDNNGAIVGWGVEVGGDDDGKYVQFRTDDGLLRIRHGAGSIDTNSAVTDDEWHAVAVTVAENASIEWPAVKLYIDGAEDGIHSADSSPFNITADFDVVIGIEHDLAGRQFIAEIDEVRIFDRELSGDEVSALALTPTASNPSPADGAAISETDVLLQWTRGFYAADVNGHHLYFSDSFADVDAGMPSVSKGRLSNEFYYVAGLALGTTYYWRVDEVNEPDTWRGDVWSFDLPDIKAWRPNPADGARYVRTDVTLSWEAGLDAIIHHVYFGTNYADVANGTGGTDKGQQTETTFPPGPLATDTVYYWRIDEFKTDTTTETGDVWSFRTRPVIPITDPDLVGWWTLDEGQGDTALDWSGHENHGTLRGDTQWVPGYDGDALSFDGSMDYVAIEDLYYDGNDYTEVTVCAWIRTTGNNMTIVSFDRSEYWRLEVGLFAGDGQVGWDVMTIFEGTDIQVDLSSTTLVNDGQWHHVAGVFDNGRMVIYIDGRPDVSYMAAPVFGNYDTVTRYGFIGCGSEATGFDGNKGTANYFVGDIDNVRIYNKGLTQSEIAEAMRGDLLVAWNPRPFHGSMPDIEHVTPLTWSAGDNAAQHDIYFGTDPGAVADADSSDTTGVYRGRRDPNSYTPPDTIEALQTYYWRIDEYNTDASISQGRLWYFTVADYLVVEDFESYTEDLGNRVFQTWIDGWGYTQPPPGNPGNGTGATIGPDGSPWVERIIVSGGSQSMPFEYVNDGSTGKKLYSEVERTFSPPQDWTRQGVEALTLWFRGYPASVGSFSYDPATGIYTLTAGGEDIWNDADQFHYVFKSLSGTGTIEAQVLSVDHTHAFAKAGVMIRETLDPNSTFAAVYVTPDNGCRFQARLVTGDDAVSDTDVTQLAHIRAPHWVKLERGLSNSFRAYDSNDPASEGWHPLAWNPQTVAMEMDVHIGLALTSHDAANMCVAKFSDVATTGTGMWRSQDIGITSNSTDQLYVAVEDSTGASNVVEHEDPNAVLLDTWQEWNIAMNALSDGGRVNVQSVKKMYIGVGDRVVPTAGGTGLLYVDDIRIYRPRCLADVIKPAGDFSSDCIVDYADLQILVNNWLATSYEVTPMAVSSANLVAHYKFDGNANDSSGNGNHGTEMWGPTYVAGVDSQAISLDGFDDYVAIQNLNYAAGGHPEVSVCAWVRTSNSDNQTIASFDRNEYWRFEVNGEGIGDGQVGLKIMTSAGQMDYGSVSRVDDGQWHHVAGVFDNGTLATYVDGHLEGSALGGSTFGTGNTRYGFVGQCSEAEEFDGLTGDPWRFDGDLDDVRIYSRALSQGEVGTLAGKTAAYTQALHLLLTPQDAAINVHADNTIDFKDYALFVDGWLDQALWP